MRSRRDDLSQGREQPLPRTMIGEIVIGVADHCHGRPRIGREPFAAFPEIGTKFRQAVIAFRKDESHLCTPARKGPHEPVDLPMKPALLGQAAEPRSELTHEPFRKAKGNMARDGNNSKLAREKTL